MTSDPSFGKALLALGPKDLKSFDVNIAFHLVSNAEAPEYFPERQNWLEEKVRDLQQLISRLYMYSGSSRACIICIILNLENSIEEKFFIRKYSTLLQQTQTLFLTSDLNLYNDQLKIIPYNGSDIGGIMLPIMDWYYTSQMRPPLEGGQIGL